MAVPLPRPFQRLVGQEGTTPERDLQGGRREVLEVRAETDRHARTTQDESSPALFLSAWGAGVSDFTPYLKAGKAQAKIDRPQEGE